MRNIIELQPAYLLHSRPFRDTSLLLDFLTPDFGRISAISRGARSAKSKSKSLLQPFLPVQISLSGKSDLKTLRTVEFRPGTFTLKGDRLFSAMYMNEIIVRLFQSDESDPAFFLAYEHALRELSGQETTELVLREFELTLLDTLGYGVDFTTEAFSHDPIDPESWYYFQEDSGFIKLQNSGGSGSQDVGSEELYSGVSLLNISNRDFSKSQTLKTAKHVIRGILSNHLGNTPLQSRSLFSRSRK